MEGKYYKANGEESHLVVTKINSNQYRILCEEEGWKTVSVLSKPLSASSENVEGYLHGIFTYIREPRDRGYFELLKKSGVVENEKEWLSKEFYVGCYGFQLITVTKTGLYLCGGWVNTDKWRTLWIKDGLKMPKIGKYYESAITKGAIVHVTNITGYLLPEINYETADGGSSFSHLAHRFIEYYPKEKIY